MRIIHCPLCQARMTQIPSRIEEFDDVIRTTIAHTVCPKCGYIGDTHGTPLPEWWDEDSDYGYSEEMD